MSESYVKDSVTPPAPIFLCIFLLDLFYSTLMPLNCSFYCSNVKVSEIQGKSIKNYFQFYENVWTRKDLLR